jgi:hypothetical protein
MKSTMTKNKQQVQARSTEKSDLDSITRYSISIMGGVSALVGIWAAACIISAVAGTGGPLKLAQSWFSTISGM